MSAPSSGVNRTALARANVGQTTIERRRRSGRCCCRQRCRRAALAPTTLHGGWVGVRFEQETDNVACAATGCGEQRRDVDVGVETGNTAALVDRRLSLFCAGVIAPNALEALDDFGRQLLMMLPS